MMKNKRYISATNKQFIIVAIISLITACLTIFLLATNTIPSFFTEKWMTVTYLVIILILAVASSLYSIAALSAIIVGVCLDIYFKKCEQKSQGAVKCLLSHEFKEVKLKDIAVLEEIIDLSTVSCKAKVDETGEIIFEITINAEAKGHTDDYAYFLEKFDIE